MTKHTTRKKAKPDDEPKVCLFQARGVDVEARNLINAVAKARGQKLCVAVNDAFRAAADTHLAKAS